MKNRSQNTGDRRRRADEKMKPRITRINADCILPPRTQSPQREKINHLKLDEVMTTISHN
jgi:hypothetical protein